MRSDWLAEANAGDIDIDVEINDDRIVVGQTPPRRPSQGAEGLDRDNSADHDGARALPSGREGVICCDHCDDVGFGWPMTMWILTPERCAVVAVIGWRSPYRYPDSDSS